MIPNLKKEKDCPSEWMTNSHIIAIVKAGHQKPVV